MVFMKKVSFKFIMLNIGIVLIIGSLLGIFSYMVIGDSLFSWQLHLGIGCAISFGMFGYVVVNISSKKIIDKTIKENVELCNFKSCYTFDIDDGVIKIDVKGGRVAYITRWNPFEFQVMWARDISDIKWDYQKGPFGGTRYLYVRLCYNGKIQKLSIFSSRQMHSLTDGGVRSAALRADKIVKYLQQAKATTVVVNPEYKSLIEQGRVINYLE